MLRATWFMLMLMLVLLTGCAGRDNPATPTPTGVTYNECVAQGVPSDVCVAAANDEARRVALQVFDDCTANLMGSGNWRWELAKEACASETIGWIGAHYGVGGGAIPPDDQDGNNDNDPH